MTDDARPTYLSPSELGSKEYWETYYARTLSHISQTHHHHNNKNNTTAEAGPSSNDDKDNDSEVVDDDDDPGTSWFSEHNAPEKILRFLTRRSFPLSPYQQKKKNKNKKTPACGQPSILDLGTGNGSMLALLRRKGGFGGYMVGVDYSAQSVELARELQRSRGHSAYWSEGEEEEDEEEEENDDDDEEKEDDDDQEGGEEDKTDKTEGKGQRREEAIRFEEWDILNSEAALSPWGTPMTPRPSSSSTSEQERLPWFPYGQGGFDLVLDKGTFDAVSLADDAKTTRVCERYPDIVRRLVRRGGFIVVTSCNWTEEELIKWFTGREASGRNGNDRLVVWGRVEYPRFQFGGREGQGVSTVCFERVGDV